MIIGMYMELQISASLEIMFLAPFGVVGVFSEYPSMPQVGTIALLMLSGLLVFLLFFVAATVNTIIVSLLVSLAAVGGFLALFFSCVAAIYIGTLLIAVIVISTATISAIFGVLIAAGSVFLYVFHSFC